MFYIPARYPEAIMACQKREELKNRAIEALNHLNKLTVGQVECLRANDLRRLFELDQQLEQAFGAKERAFGALAEHAKEHACD
jgi:hypothetical protein